MRYIKITLEKKEMMICSKCGKEVSGRKMVYLRVSKNGISDEKLCWDCYKEWA